MPFNQADLKQIGNEGYLPIKVAAPHLNMSDRQLRREVATDTAFKSDTYGYRNRACKYAMHRSSTLQFGNIRSVPCPELPAGDVHSIFQHDSVILL